MYEVLKIPIGELLDKVDWVLCKESYATHKGILKVAGFEFKVYKLNNGQRIIDSKSLTEFLNRVKEEVEGE